MTRILFFLIIYAILPLESRAQLSSNKYYEVLDSCDNTSRATFPLDDGRLLSYSKKGEGPTYLLHENRLKTELPCNKIKLNITRDFNCFKCINDDGKSAFVSLESDQLISPFYDSLSVINSNFYIVWQKDSVYIFNSKNKLLFQTIAEISRPLSKQYFKHCNDEQLFCKTADKEFYLNVYGEVSKDEICNIDIQNAYFSDGTYLFKQDKKWGLKNKEGAILIGANYNHIENWQDGKYIVRVKQDNSNNSLYGIVDQNENILLPIEYDWITDYEFGLAVRKKGCKSTFLDNNLKNKYEEEFDELRVLKCGMVRGKKGDKNFYDLIFTEKVEGTEGEIVTIQGISTERGQVLYENGLLVIYDKSGNMIFSHKGEADITKIHETVLQIKFDSKKSGLINATGEWIVEPGNYKFKATKFNGGIYKTNLDSNQSDLLNSQGELLYSNVTRGGLISSKENHIVNRGQKSAVVSPKGELLIPFGKYRIHEFDPNYYRLTMGNKDYVVQLK